jgi:transcriptional regulator GlxA family with amidase domain
MTDDPETVPLKIDLLVVPQTTPTTLFAFLEVFAAVGVAWERITGRVARARRIETRIVARSTDPFPSALGPLIAPQASLGEAGPADVVIVTDLALEDGLPPAESWAEECGWLRRQQDSGAMLCSVCTGSALLAAAGILDGLEATTHWAAADLFRVSFPKVHLRPERVLCPAGPGHRIVTGGGQGSWEDLALHLIARHSGPAEAARIARLFVLGDRSQGQLAFSALGRPREHDDGVIGESQVWLADNYARSHPVRIMVERSGLAERSFKRRFRAATGYSAIDYVQALRIEEAKQLLETSEHPTDDVARAVGYEDAAYFRRLFRRRTGLAPSEYRRRFRPSAFLKAP